MPSSYPHRLAVRTRHYDWRNAGSNPVEDFTSTRLSIFRHITDSDARGNMTENTIESGESGENPTIAVVYLKI